MCQTSRRHFNLELHRLGIAGLRACFRIFRHRIDEEALPWVLPILVLRTVELYLRLQRAALLEHDRCLLRIVLISRAVFEKLFFENGLADLIARFILQNDAKFVNQRKDIHRRLGGHGRLQGD